MGYIFKCLATDLNVQGYKQEHEPGADDRPRYEMVSCLPAANCT
jgi:hypothetical protein